MKKIISLVVCFALLLSCAVSLAETDKVNLGSVTVNGEFTLQANMMEGYAFRISSMDNGVLTGFISSEDLTRPVLQLSISFDESMSDVERMNDLGEEDLALLEQSFRDMNEVDITYTETTHGTKVMVVREIGADRDFVDFFSVYKGYSIEFVMVAGPEAQDTSLTDEQVQMCIQFLSDLDFVPIAK